MPSTPQKLLALLSLEMLFFTGAFAQRTYETAEYQINPLPAGINTEAREFAPVFRKDTLYFTLSGKSGFDLAYCRCIDQDSCTEPVLFSSLNTSWHEGTLAFCEATGQIFFTRNFTRNHHPVKNAAGEIPLAIYVTGLHSPGDSVGLLPFIRPEYNYAHPTLSSDGNTLYFASDLPGGYGGKDIWMSQRNSDGWSVPIHLDSTVNSPADEVFPFLFEDSLLFFSSNRNEKGLDIFVSYLHSGQTAILPAPINSDDDDFGFFLLPSGKKGFFSSDRSGGKGQDDIYQFRMISPLAVNVRLVLTDEHNRPVKNEKVLAIAASDTLTKLTGENGDVSFSLPAFAEAEIIFDEPGFEPLRRTIKTNKDSIQKHLTCRHRAKTIRGRILALDLNTPLPGARVKIISGETNPEIQIVQTRDDGSFEFSLPVQVRKYRLKAEKQGYVAYERDFDSGEMPVITLVSIQDGIIRETLVLNNIYYDFNDTHIRDDSAEELDRLAEILKEHPDLHIALVAYTDSRGSAQYNARLSRHRARAARDYLIAKGINPERISAYGRGERNLRNRCRDGVPCTEEEHAYNRRTEVIIKNHPLDLQYLRKLWAGKE